MSSILKVAAVVLIATFCHALVAVAHPGHGVPGQGFELVHYMTAPVHVLGMFVRVALVVGTAFVLRRLLAR